MMCNILFFSLPKRHIKASDYTYLFKFSCSANRFCKNNFVKNNTFIKNNTKPNKSMFSAINTNHNDN